MLVGSPRLTLLRVIPRGSSGSEGTDLLTLTPFLFLLAEVQLLCRLLP